MTLLHRQGQHLQKLSESGTDWRSDPRRTGRTSLPSPSKDSSRVLDILRCEGEPTLHQPRWAGTRTVGIRGALLHY